jgi:hypothetical protein
MDRRNDGVISEDELEPPAGRGAQAGNRGARRTQRFESLDRNGNGRIEAREWDGTVAAFNRLDANNDNALTRAEMVGNVADEPVSVGTSGQSPSREVRVESRVRWTDTGIDVRAGQTLAFDARGTVRLGPTQNDVAGVDGTMSRRRDTGAPMANQPEGALIARIGNSPVFYLGDQNYVRAPANGRLYLGVNDGDLAAAPRCHSSVLRCRVTLRQVRFYVALNLASAPTGTALESMTHREMDVPSCHPDSHIFCLSTASI